MHRLRAPTSMLRMPFPKPLSRNISLTCRGEPIQAEQLLEYTKGRFVARFDLNALCNLVSSLPSIPSPIAKVDKLEGGFNKALLMTAENGEEVIAKIPCPNVVPPRYSAASEAAVLQYVRSKTSVPAPEVLAWSSDSSNPIQSEYIVMQKAEGIQLVDVWGDMNQLQQFKLIQNLVRLEGELASLKFPAYGNLYFRHSPHLVGSDDDVIPFDYDDEYWIGPAYNAAWFPQPGKTHHTAPCANLSDLGLALANRGLCKVKQSPLIPRRPHFGSQTEHIELLRTAMETITKVVELPHLERVSRLILWHGDLHLGNIFVSNDDPTTIVGIIDWQFACIKPVFLQVQWPFFLRPPEGYEFGLVQPKLPANFDEMNDGEKAYAESERDDALLAKLRDLFSLCERTWEDGIIPLRDSLKEISENWHHMGISGSCAYRISNEVAAKHDVELSRYKDWETLKGYTHPLLDFNEVRERHDELFQLYMQREPEVMAEQEARSLWFYIDRT
ncbi:kinase-like domain-containing protein [Aspergillus pseudoustus]|uniref:Altered inheritance of mitochondria protein 9, mitochondrial n=1 Tax=Aspergillus pseudoustus TaxID=1810923 RepID=A0ABR4JN47_9EURO